MKQNKCGFALVTTLIFMTLLMLLIGGLSSTGIIETLLSGTAARSRAALAAAEAGIEYVRGTFVLIGNSPPQSGITGGNSLAAAKAALPASQSSRLTFLNNSSMGVDESLLAGSGFSGKYVASGGSALKLRPYRTQIRARATVGGSIKNLEVEGYSLAP